MIPYESLAAAYDGLTTDVDYEAVLAFFQSVPKRNHKEPERILDLACGTGSMSVLLAMAGYQVLGADISEEMLTVAAQRQHLSGLLRRSSSVNLCNGCVCLTGWTLFAVSWIV